MGLDQLRTPWHKRSPLTLACRTSCKSVSKGDNMITITVSMSPNLEEHNFRSLHVCTCTLHCRFELGLNFVLLLGGRASQEWYCLILVLVRAHVAKADHAKLFQTIMSAWLITSAGFGPLCPHNVRHIVSANPKFPRTIFHRKIF